MSLKQILSSHPLSPLTGIRCWHVIFVISASASNLLAGPIQYSLTATGSGKLGSTSFFSRLFTFTSLADTDEVLLFSPGIYYVPNTSATVTVAGLPTATFLVSTINAANNNIPAVGFSDHTNNLAILFCEGAATSGYQLKTATGPILGSAGFNIATSFATSSGSFVLNSVTSQVTFQATLVPEPSTAVFAASIFALLASHRRRRG